MVADFESIRILDNYYQTSSFFPMPVVLLSTVSEAGQTNLGPYSLCFPFVIADQGKFSMMLASQSDSNTAMNIKRTVLVGITLVLAAAMAACAAAAQDQPPAQDSTLPGTEWALPLAGHRDQRTGGHVGLLWRARAV